jgi:small GTP-binding protein
MSALQKIADIEHEMSRTQKNKNTMAHLCALKARMALLKRELISTEAKSKGGPKGEGFDVQKTGDARIGYIGFPSVGKSTLLNKMTNTFSEVADYEFTTLTCVPGIVKFRGAKLQMLDLPGIIEGAKDGKGRGRQVIAVARTCSLILLVLDVMKPLQHKLIIERELEGFGIRLNKMPPNISIKKKDRGGLSIASTVPLTHLDEETIKAVCSEYKMLNCDLFFKGDYTEDEFIDAIEGSRVYIPAIFVMNKIDQISIEELDIISRIPHNCPISAEHNWNLDGLLECIWDHLNFIRIYTKPRGQVPDYNEPVILKVKAETVPTVESFCLRLHKLMLKKLKYAWVWGASAKHQPQRVGKEHVLADEDVVQIVKRI